MGRGGGSHGGGGHSGGRSFGGRGGGFGGAGGRGPGGPGFGGPQWGGPFWGGPRRSWGGPVFFGRGPGRGGGCFSGIFIIIFFLVLFSNFIPDSGSSRNTEVTVSRTERTAVTGTDTYPEWYVDELNFIDHDRDLTDGLKYFYSQTGIQPYVMLLDYDPSLWENGKWNETAAEKYLSQIYADTFSDNGHLIFAYFACENDSEDMDGTFYFYYGSAAYSIMDDEAETIFWSYFDMNYNNLDLSIAEFIGQTFEETADNIMHVGNGGDNTLIKRAVIFAVICVAVIIIGIIVARRTGRREYPGE